MSERWPVTGARERAWAFVTGTALSLALTACSERLAPGLDTSAEPVIYGENTSREWVDRERAPGELARAVALIPRRVMDDAVDEAKPTLGELHPELCPETPWIEQPSLAVCTGVLAGASWALTARHCFDSIPCEDYAIVRSFGVDRGGRLSPWRSDDTFRCVRVLGDGGASDAEVVVFELDRAAEAEPLALVEAFDLAAGAPLFAAGHPLGTPLKVDEDAFLLTGAPLRIWADAFAGSSGAPVVDDTGALLGLLTGGARDFELDPRGCFSVRQLAAVDQAGGEHVEAPGIVLCEACRAEPESVACRAVSEATCAPGGRSVAEAPGAGCALSPRRAPGRSTPLFLVIGVAFAFRRARGARRRRPR